MELVSKAYISKILRSSRSRYYKEDS